MEEVEYIDVYDIHHEPTGLIMPRKHLDLKPGQYMLYVLAILEDPENRILVTRRSLNKKWAAGAWEVPGGGVKHGESSEAALIREVHEETGLDVSAIVSEPIWSYVNDDPESGDNYLVDIYHLHLPIPETSVSLQKSEAIDWKLASRAEIDAMNE
ncbi:MAG: NUDIX domain-containing protein, partial [Bulleidia sp.]